MLVDQNEISWKSMIHDIVTTEGMDPWNVNISLLVDKFIERLNKYKNIELKVSGKVLLAAAILLSIKSKRLVGEDLNEFDRLIATNEVSEGEFYDSLEQELSAGEKIAIEHNYELVPRTPQPRKRKVSVYDLVKALEKALEVKNRRFMRNPEVEMKIPEKKIDISLAIKNLYDKITGFFQPINFVNQETTNETISDADKLFKSDFWQRKKWMDDNDKLIKLIPPDASVATQNNLAVCFFQIIRCHQINKSTCTNWHKSGC